MKNEKYNGSRDALQKHQKSDTIKWIIAFSLIFVLLAGLAFTIWGTFYLHYDGDIPADAAQKVVDELLPNKTEEPETVAQTFSPIKLKSGATTVTADGTISKTLTATVYPEDADDKRVDWSVAWEDTSETEHIADYMMVTTAEDGGAVATVTCKKAFGDKKIIVTATLRNGNGSATCVCTYLGAPTEMRLEDANGNVLGTETIVLEKGQTYSLNVILDNALHSVGEEFQKFDLENFNIEEKVYGALNVRDFREYDDGTVEYGEVYTISDSQIWTGRFFDIDNRYTNAPKIVVHGNLHDYYEWMDMNYDDSKGMSYYYTDGEFVSIAEPVYFEFVFTHKLTGLSQTLRVEISQADATDVTLDSETLVF